MKKEVKFENVFILEMANNHQGDVEHGLRIIREFHKVVKEFPFQFCIKFQYRYIDTFVHPDFIDRTDIKLIKRFTETILDENQYKTLKDEAEKLGFLTMCTPFDEKAVQLVVDHEYDIIKIPSCYFTDWPLLEKIAATDLPIIASTAGAKLEDINNVVSFFQHREKQFALMHCVGEYPTVNEHLQLNQIDLLKSRYSDVPIGFSTHEGPENIESIQIAIGKGATLFEKHVGLNTDEYQLNGYSADPDQLKKWLEAALTAVEMSGSSTARYEASEKETADLRALHRGMYVKTDLKKGDVLTSDNVFFAMPNQDKQIVANEYSKYLDIVLEKDIPANGPVYWDDVTHSDKRSEILKITTKTQEMLNEAKVALPNQVEVMISHHHGLDRFDEWGGVLINVINKAYCKMLIVLFPGQKYPSHTHKLKDETLHILSGELIVTIENEDKVLKTGDVISIDTNVEHSFSSTTGVVFEEVSTTYVQGDSYYEKTIYDNPNRKTCLTYWPDWNK